MEFNSVKSSEENNGIAINHVFAECGQTYGNRTYFDPNGLVSEHSGSGKPEFMIGYQQGTHNGMWRNDAVINREIRYRRFHNVGGQLEMPKYHRKEAYKVFKQANHSVMGRHHELTAFAAFALVVAVVDQRNWLHEFTPDVEHPEENLNALGDDDPDAPDSGVFKDTIRQFGFTVDDVKGAVRKLRDHALPPYGNEKVPDWRQEDESDQPNEVQAAIEEWEEEQEPGHNWPYPSDPSPEDVERVNREMSQK